MSSKTKGIISVVVACLLVLSIIAVWNWQRAEEPVEDLVKEPVAEDPAEVPDDEQVKEPVGEPTVITLASHAPRFWDHALRDEITGEPFLSPEELRAAELAWQTVLDELNVRLEFIPYPADIREALLRSVLAGDPIADLVRMWGGSQGVILGQNVLQPLDDFAHIFLDDEDSEWILVDRMFGKHYMLNFHKDFLRKWPLVFNATYIEQVEALKEDGDTVFPCELFRRGEWTWSRFEEYLTKINAHFTGRPSPVRPEVPIKAFQTDYRNTVVHALHSNGVAVFGANGLEVATPEAIQAVELINRLTDKGLMMTAVHSNSVYPGWLWHCNDFANGETVFTNMAPWLTAMAGTRLAERGESMGIVPFPRPDHLEVDDPRYRPLTEVRDTVGILRGVPRETTELALNAFRLYVNTRAKALAGTDTTMEFMEARVETSALAAGFDLLHPQIGENIKYIFKYFGRAPVNEFSPVVHIGNWAVEIVGEAIYGFDDSPEYDVAIAAEKSVLLENIAITERALGLDRPTDNIAPRFVRLDPVKPPAFTLGTDGETIDWSTIFRPEDNVDGELNMENAVIDISAIDFNVIGRADNAFVATIKDAAGNEGTFRSHIFIFDPNNIDPPILEIREDRRNIRQNEDAETINWNNYFIKTATDADGIDIRFSLSVDLGELDTSTAGVYEVEATITDFVGNQTSKKFEVIVEASQ